jgi:prepilin-type N-terminal cleavage/methylation domain-containing protein
MKKFAQNKGFTLVELLIAVTILAILSSIGLVTYSSAQVSGRDSRRKQDLHSIATALSFYYENHLPHVYPHEDGGPYTSSNNPTGPWIPELTGQYLDNVPRDPSKDTGTVQTSSSAWGYEYLAYSTCRSGGPQSANTHWFKLMANLENGNDKDINYNDGNDCDPGGSADCGSNNHLYCIRSY